MPMVLSPPLPIEEYERAAVEYQKSLPLEHYMESTGQSTQRAITTESFEVLSTRRSEIRCFGELLLQYLYEGVLRQVVPDNMVFIEPLPEQPRGSYNLEVEQVQPFLMLEYVSESNPRKDYVDNFQKYSRQLKVPYYLLFRPDRLDLQIYRMDDGAYVRLEPGPRGRIAIPEIDLEVALYENWVRFWHEGELIPVPREFVEQVREARDLATHRQQIINQQSQRIDEQSQVIDEQSQAIRRLVERAALRAARQDILDQLGRACDSAQLQRWLKELDSFL